MKTNEAKMNEFKKNHPVQQSFHTGLWGYARTRGCLDLSKCIYKTKREAELYRKLAACCTD